MSNEWDSVIPVMISTDMFKYHILKEYGGVYIDFDQRLETNINWLVDTTDFFCSIWDWVYLANVNLNFFAAKPQHQILVKSVELVKLASKVLL